MKIAEMNNCIEKMREIYKFDDEKTEIRLLPENGHFTCDRLEIVSEDKNGTVVTLERRIDELVEIE